MYWVLVLIGFLAVLAGSMVINFIPATLVWVITDVIWSFDLGYWNIFWTTFCVVTLFNLTIKVGKKPENGGK